MLPVIGRIGIFMIAAQAMVHFAPGTQYEKYIKSVAGIIILSLFLKPVLQVFDVQIQEPQAVLERMKEWTDMPDLVLAEPESDMDARVVTGMEEEVKKLLNRNMEGEDYLVSDVSIRFVAEKEAEQENLLAVVEVRMAERSEAKEEGQIEIEEIVIGRDEGISSQEDFSIYRERFAVLLGIEKERVEVRRDGASEKVF